MERSVRRRLDDLPLLFELAGEFFARYGIDARHKVEVDLVLEEIFTNAVRHGSQTEDEIVVEIDRRGDAIAISITDRDAEEFDPTALPPPATDAPLEEREPGGLGIHLVRRLTDEIEYVHHERTSRVTVLRKLG